MMNVAVAGALGRMGSSIIRSLKYQTDMELVAAVEAPGKPEKGKDIGELIGVGKLGVNLTTADGLREVLRESKSEVLVDFTVAKAAMETVKISAAEGVDLVIGTTGFTNEQLSDVETVVNANKVSAVLSPNMATGVNVFFKIAQNMADAIGESFDIEIIEAHHKHKKDAPSGTAIRVGELITQKTGQNIEKDGVFGRERGMIGERGNEIGFHSIRGGDIVGDHIVLFAGDGERLELTHRAHSRQAFVNGAIKAIRFIQENRGKGGVFSTWDVLGIK
jgi:4-hydroxy-tetrahydrodipicolinate reductase